MSPSLCETFDFINCIKSMTFSFAFKTHFWCFTDKNIPVFLATQQHLLVASLLKWCAPVRGSSCMCCSCICVSIWRCVWAPAGLRYKRKPQRSKKCGGKKGLLRSEWAHFTGNNLSRLKATAVGRKTRGCCFSDEHGTVRKRDAAEARKCHKRVELNLHW